MSADEDVVERLDRLITLFSIAFRDLIERERETIREDPVAAAILDASSEEWVSSGDLQRCVAAATGVSERTVLRSMVVLAGRGLLSVRGAGRLTSYRSTGVL